MSEKTVESICHECEVFQKFINSIDRPVACETARATGKCLFEQILKDHDAEIAKWDQQQKDDYATYLDKVAEKDKEIQKLQGKIEAINLFAKKLNQKLDEAKSVLHDKRYANGESGKQWWKGKRALLEELTAQLRSLVEEKPKENVKP